MLQRERKGLEEFLFVEDKHNLLPQLKWAVLICSPLNHEVILMKEARILNLISLWNRLQIIWVVFH